MEIIIQQLIEEIKALRSDLRQTSSYWLDVEGVSSYVHISKGQVYKLVSSGQIPHKRLNGKILFNKKQIDYWLLTESKNPTKRQREEVEHFING